MIKKYKKAKWVWNSEKKKLGDLAPAQLMSILNTVQTQRGIWFGKKAYYWECAVKALLVEKKNQAYFKPFPVLLTEMHSRMVKRAEYNTEVLFKKLKLDTLEYKYKSYENNNIFQKK